MLALTTLFWAGNFVLGRAFSTDIEPITLAFIRWAAALLVLLPFALPALWRNRELILANGARLFVLGALSVAGFNTFAYLGLQSTTAMNGTLMQSTMPIMILLLSAIFLKEMASLKQWLGVVVSLAGVLVLISQAQIERLFQLEFNKGDLWIIFAMLIWGIYSIGLRWKPKELSAFAFFSTTLVVGVVILAPLSWWEMQGAPAIEWNNDLYLLFAYLAVFPSILAYLFWNYGVEKLGAQRSGLFIHLVPLWGMILSIIFLGEQVQTFHLVGMALIFSGIYLAVLSGSAFHKK
ncbi:DMT family transporter [Neptuniibacter sp.]|uniref:DMT family transporter n=1 Tax=Neptuniibacter sp. TaxID=1962643 RepID=UPI002631F424|nr:DMT family transporter [Neptuniibacter sp.]MCP4595691.1 DMT family transporter [Neptuniibacter sp.]